MADIWSNEIVSRYRVVSQVGHEFGIRSDVRDAVRVVWVVGPGNVVKINEWVVTDCVSANVAERHVRIVYVLLIADRGFYGGFGYSGDSEMKKLSAETGGRVIEVGNKFEKLKQAFDQIAQELRSQYNIGYTPTNSKRDGTFRKVEIKAKQQGYKIQARSGYYAMIRE